MVCQTDTRSHASDYNSVLLLIFATKFKIKVTKNISVFDVLRNESVFCMAKYPKMFD